MAPTHEQLHKYRPKIEQIGRNFGVLQVRVFGSVARESANDASDIDLLVRMEPGRTLLDVIGFEQAVSELLQIKVDVVEEGGIHPRLEPVILREARPL